MKNKMKIFLYSIFVIFFTITMYAGKIYFFKTHQYKIPSFSAEMEKDLVQIIWYKVTPSGFEPVKRWSEEEAKEIFRLILKEPDVKDYPYFEEVFKMSLIFYSGTEGSLNLKEFWFEVVAEKFYSEVTWVNYELGEKLSPYLPERWIFDKK